MLLPLWYLALAPACLTGPHENDVPEPGRYSLVMSFTLDGAPRVIEGELVISQSSTDGLQHTLTIAGALAGSGLAKWVNPDGFRIIGTSEGLTLVTHLKRLGDNHGCRGRVERSSSGGTTEVSALCSYNRVGPLGG
jgi:hypothetical protein